MQKEYKKIFKRGSRTFFFSSLFFPRETLKDVSILYAFVRVADDFVDRIPQDREGFLGFVHMYQKALAGHLVAESLHARIIKDFIVLSKKHAFDQSFIDAFFASMESDLNKHTYDTLEETKKYIYGSAEVIGLMMNRIMHVDVKYDQAARDLGYAFQYINFIRDIAEDQSLGRTYLPKERYNKYGLGSLSIKEVSKNKESFVNFLREEVMSFESILEQASGAFPSMPLRFRIPIMLASAAYKYTGQVIKRNPLIVYKKKVKPTKIKLFFEFIKIICSPKTYKNK